MFGLDYVSRDVELHWYPQCSETGGVNCCV